MSREREKVLILGGGFGGAYCARELERLTGATGPEIVVIDRHDYLLFYPLLIEAGTGSLQPRHVVVPIRSFLRTAGFRMAEVLSVDCVKRQVTLRPAHEKTSVVLGYDHLVLALGSVTRLPDIPGLREHGFEMKSLADAVALRDRCISLLEAADAATDRMRQRALLHTVVVGGNFTGVEVAGELHAFQRRAARKFRHLSPEDCAVTLVELGDGILPALDPDLASYAQHHLSRRGVQTRLRSTVREIHEDHVILDDETALPACTVIWCAGIAPHPLLQGTALPRDDKGYILCDGDLRVQGFEDVWAIGDCAVTRDPQGQPYPATAQQAIRQGKHLARNLFQVLSGRMTSAYRHDSIGSLAALGCRMGVAEIMGIKISGLPAWWLYRTVYLWRMPGFFRKTKVALDWTLDSLFPRDDVQIGIHHQGR